MIKIDGKTIITSDWHFGLSQNRLSKLRIMTNVVNEIDKFKCENGYRNIIFAGDIFHQRNILSIETINIAIASIEKLAEKCNIYLILGNHDIFSKNSNAINSMKIFKSIKNVHIIESATECSINGNNTLLVPWNTELGNFDYNSYDMMIGHFDISPQYLYEVYLEDGKRKNIAINETLKKINSDEFLREAGLTDMDSEEIPSDEIINGHNSSELIGDWIQLVKERGIIFSGHIHGHREFYTKNRRFIFIGSPYQQNMGEIDSEDGFYTIDADNEIQFIKLDGIPVHINLKMSDIVKDFEGFDFSIVRGNIVHQVFDIDVDNEMTSRISQRILDNHPFEELQPDYSSNTTLTQGDDGSSFVDHIRKSKMDYICAYIENIDKKVLSDEGIDRIKLVDYMRKYHDIANEKT